MSVITACAGCGKHPLTVEIDQLPAFCPDCKDKEDERKKWLDLTVAQRIDTLKAKIEALEAQAKEKSDGKTSKRQRSGK